MGTLKTRTGLSSLANSDVLGQLSIDGGGASIPFLIEGATNRLLEIKDASSGRVALVKDASGNELFEILTTGLTVGGNYTFPLTDGTANYVLKTDGSGTLTWADPLANLAINGISDVDTSPFSTAALHGAYLRYNIGSSNEWVADGPYTGFSAARQTGTVTVATPVKRTGSSDYGAGLYEIGVGETDNNSRCIGLAYGAPVSNKLIVITDGIIGDIDTSAFSVDDVLYVSNTAGALTATAPTSGLYQQKVARVIAADATNGIIQVTVDPTFDENTYLEDVSAESISDLNDVNTTGAVAGNLLRYDGGGWIDTTLTMPTSFTVSGKSKFATGATSNTITFDTVELEDLDGVDLTSTAPTTNDVLQYDGSNWVAAASTSNTPNLNEVTTEGNTTSNSISSTATFTSTVSSLTSNFQAFSQNSDASDWSPFYGLRFSSTPAAADILMSFPFHGMNSATQVTKYANISGHIGATTDGSEDGILTLEVMNNGAIEESIKITAGGIRFFDEYTFPGSDGSANQILRSNGSGTLSFGDQQQLENRDQELVGTRVIELSGNTLNINESDDLVMSFEEGAVTIGSGGSQGAGELRFQEETTNGTNYVGLRAPTSLSSDLCYTLPSADGTSGQVLQTNGSGVMSWATASGSGGTPSLQDVMDESATEGSIGNIVYKGAGGWQFLDSSSAFSPTLQQVTSNGSSTSVGISINSIIMSGTLLSVNSMSMLGTGDNTFTGLIHANGGIEADGQSLFIGSSNDDTVTLKRVDSGATGANLLRLFKDSSSPADDDVLGVINFDGNDTAAAAFTYASIEAVSTDVTNVTEDGKLVLKAASAGGMTIETLAVEQQGITFHEQYQFPNVDGTDGQVLITDGTGNVDWGTPTTDSFVGRQWSWDRRGIHQLTTSTDTRYRFSTSTTYPEYGNWNRSSTTIPSSITRSLLYSKAGHMVTTTLADCKVSLTVITSASTSTSTATSTSDLTGEDYSFHLYKWPTGSSATLLGTATGTFNNTNSSSETLATLDLTGVALTRGDMLTVVGKLTANTTSTRYWHVNYSLLVEEQDTL